MGTEERKNQAGPKEVGETRILDRTPATGLPPPERIGEYVVIKAIGEGGMGAVLLCRDAELQRQVAIKLIRPELIGNEEFVRRFLSEARLTASLNHPNVVTTFAVGRHEGSPFIVMEYVDGRTLRDLLRTPPPVPLERILEIFVQCCDGLEAAARKGIVHRDVKPANIMVREDGLVKVMDFGLSKRVEGDSITVSNAIMGTPDYMAPEQAAGKPVDYRADIYSLGIALFQCVSGYIPFRASSVWEIIAKHASEPLPDDKRIKDIADGRLWDLLDRMTAKTPEERPGSYSIIRQELGEIRAAVLKAAGTTAPAPSQLFGETIPLRQRDATPATAPGSKAVRRRPSATIEKGRRRSRSVAMIGGGLAAVLACAIIPVWLLGGFGDLFGKPPAADPTSSPTSTAAALPTPAAMPPTNEPLAGTGAITMRSGRGAVVEDVLKSLGAFGVNYLLDAKLTTRSVPVATTLRNRRSRDVFDSLALACGWQVVDDGGLFRISQRERHHPADSIARHRDQLDAALLPRASIATAGGIKSLRQACEAIAAETGLDYIIVTDIADRPLPDLSVTQFPLGNLFALINKEGRAFEWTVKDSIILIVPARQRTE